MADIKLRIVTPTGELYNDDANMVIMRGANGDIGVLKGHQPLTTTLDYGLLKIKTGEKELVSTLFGGFADIQPDCITILTDSAEWIDDIDVKRAEEAKERAEERLRTKDNIDVMRAELALKRAMLRINAKK
ncbi:MAG: F0F1 ATP synthase subunit epsilon [Eubacteriales bacterium]|nr:F0F1 ATP synthase subunit epsilon [Eubacteriales bacterium]